MKIKNGFTLIELIIAIAITAVLSGIVLFSVTQYINKGKDSNLFGNLAILSPAGEVYYNGNGNTYDGFCDMAKNSVMRNVYSQVKFNIGAGGSCDSGPIAGLCCAISSSMDAWAVCAVEFSNPNHAFCVDSRGVKKEICKTDCSIARTACDTDLSACQ